jgi:hypothetical protein
VLAAFAAHAAVVLDRRLLKQEAGQARELAEGNRVRTSLLAAAGHDLRTPLATIKAAVTSLRNGDIEWSEQDQAELLASIEEGNGLGGRSRARVALPTEHQQGMQRIVEPGRRAEHPHRQQRPDEGRHPDERCGDRLGYRPDPSPQRSPLHHERILPRATCAAPITAPAARFRAR